MVGDDETPEPPSAPGGGSGPPERRTFSQLLADLAAAPRGSQWAAWTRGFRPGDVVIDRFELLDRLGRGGFGVVLKAHDRKLKRDVAFKAIRPGGQANEAIQREAEISAKLEHNNLVRLYDFGQCDSGAFLVLELLSGETLGRRLARGPLPIHEAVQIALQVSRALIHAHALGVLHRDLKPSNVFLAESGEVKVLDFGLAYYFGEGLARSGTPGYMAPEQVAGGPEDARTDIFAVGVLLREMVTGKSPSAVSPTTERRVRLRKDGLPPRLAQLVASATDPDPARRPGDATRLAKALELLLRQPVVSRRRTVFLAVVGVLLLTGAIAGRLSARWSSASRTRSLVTIADLENKTGDPALDALAGLLITSLEQSAGLAVLPRRRVLSLAGAPSGSPARVECETAHRAGRLAGARAVICGRVSRLGGEYVVQLDATDPDGTTLFGPIDGKAQSREDLVRLLDELSDRTRKKLRAPAPPDSGERTAPTVLSMEAYRHYYSGEQCVDRAVHGQDCAAELRQALELDPEFAPASYQLAIWSTWNGAPFAEQQSLIHRALDGRAPRKERTLIRAWAAHLDGNDDEAISLLGEAANAWPSDKQSYYQAADILRHRDDLSAALPWFEKTIELEPDYPWATGGLAQTLGALGRMEDLRTWASRWEEIRQPGTLHGLSLARGWLGDVQGAVDAARRAVDLGAGVTAQEDLLAAEVFAGNYPVVRHGALELAARGSPVRRMGYYGLAGLEAYQGRWHSGLAKLDELERELPEVRKDAVYHAIRADYLLGLGDPAAVWAEVNAVRRLDPHLAAEHAVSLAYLGDTEHAAILAQDLPRGSALAETYEALARLQRDMPGALEDLRRISAATPVFAWRLAPLFIYGEQLSARGRDAEAVEVLRKAQQLYVPLAMWRSWAYPRSLYLLARSCERLGRNEEARCAIDRLLTSWSQPEENSPLLADARALRDRLPSAARCR